MGKRIIPAVIVAAILSFVVAAASLAFVPETARLWSAAVALVILGGITPLIYAMNARIVPVFSGRTWQRPNALFAAMVLAIAGAWLVFAGRALPNDALEFTGASAALAGGVLFMLSIVWLFRSDRMSKATLRYPSQSRRQSTGPARTSCGWPAPICCSGCWLESCCCCGRPRVVAGTSITGGSQQRYRRPSPG